MCVHIYDGVDLCDIVEVEEEVRHVHALLGQCPELLLTIKESELLHFIQVQIALVVVLEQALEDHVLLTIWIVRGLLRTAWSQ